MNYTDLSKCEEYQIYSLLKVGQILSVVANIMDRQGSAIYREISRKSGLKVCRPKKAELIAGQRSECSRNSLKIGRSLWRSVTKLLDEKLSPEQISARLEVSYETIYKHVCVDKSFGEYPYRHLRCQKKRWPPYAVGSYRGGQIIGGRPIAVRPANVEKRS